MWSSSPLLAAVKIIKPPLKYKQTWDMCQTLKSKHTLNKSPFNMASIFIVCSYHANLFPSVLWELCQYWGAFAKIEATNRVKRTRRQFPLWSDVLASLLFSGRGRYVVHLFCKQYSSSPAVLLVIKPFFISGKVLSFLFIIFEEFRETVLHFQKQYLLLNDK